MLILVRKDDPDYKIELVRWQGVLRGWFGYTHTMPNRHRTPALFLNTVWRARKVKMVEEKAGQKKGRVRL